jgi:hypothetical protein
MAVKTYDLARHFTQKQAALYTGWRTGIVDGVQAKDESYLRPDAYDGILSALFPEMAARIATGYGLATAR